MTAVATVGLLVVATVAAILAGWNVRELTNQTRATQKTLELSALPFLAVTTRMRRTVERTVQSITGEEMMRVAVKNAGLGPATDVGVSGWLFGFEEGPYGPERLTEWVQRCSEDLAHVQPQVVGSHPLIAAGETVSVLMRSTDRFNNPGPVNEDRFLLMYKTVFVDALGRRHESGTGHLAWRLDSGQVWTSLARFKEQGTAIFEAATDGTPAQDFEEEYGIWEKAVIDYLGAATAAGRRFGGDGTPAYPLAASLTRITTLADLGTPGWVYRLLSQLGFLGELQQSYDD